MLPCYSCSLYTVAMLTEPASHGGCFTSLAGYTYIGEMRRITVWICNNLNLRTFLPLFSTALATTWYGLFWSVEHFAGLTGGLGFMDMQPLLTTDELFAQIGSYSAEAVRYYLSWSLFDFAWPLMTFSTMCFISAWLCRFLDTQWQARLWVLVAAAYTTVLIDWAENIGFMLLVSGLPDKPLWLAQVTLTLHAGKLLFNLLFNLGFFVLLGTVIASRLRR